MQVPNESLTDPEWTQLSHACHDKIYYSDRIKYETLAYRNAKKHTFPALIKQINLLKFGLISLNYWKYSKNKDYPFRKDHYYTV